MVRTSSEVVHRAARIGGGTRVERPGSRPFFGLVALIVLLGSFTVGFAWSSRQYDHPTLFDSWQSAYGVYDCTAGQWLEPFDSQQNPNGIRTRNDGVIYIEPSIEEVTGNGARLDVFLDNVGASLSDQAFVLPNGQTLTEANSTCGGEDAILQVHRWDALSPAEPIEVITEGFDTIMFLDDAEAFTIALAPAGASLPAPPSLASITPSDQVADAAIDAESGS